MRCGLAVSRPALRRSPPTLTLRAILGELRPDVETRVLDPLEDPGQGAWRRRRDRYYRWIRHHPVAYHRAYRALALAPWALAP